MTRAWLRTLQRHFVPLVFSGIGIGSLTLPILAVYYPAVPTFGSPGVSYIRGVLLFLLVAAYELVLWLERVREKQYEEQKTALEELFSDYDD